MLESPHFLRLTRALALGALAAPALQCAPAETQHGTSAVASSGSQRGASNDAQPSTLPRTAEPCRAGSARHDRVEGREFIVCGCEASEVPRWSCTSFPRIAGGLDAQPCAEPSQVRGDDPPYPNQLCMCVANGARAEYACYQTIAMAPGPLPPPEWPREIVS